MFEKFYNLLIAGGAWLTILEGLWATVKISFFALVLDTLLGSGICAMRRVKHRILRIPASLYIAVLRGLSVLMLLMLLYYVVFAKTDMDAINVAIITFGLNTAAYIAELMRASLDATDKGQIRRYPLLQSERKNPLYRGDNEKLSNANTLHICQS